MAEAITPSPATPPPKPRNKIRTMRIWLWVASLLFAATFFLSQCAMSKPQAKGKIIASCIKNSPFAPTWAQELAQYGLADQSDRVIEPYCICMWDEPLEAMSSKEITTFAKMPSEEKLQALGGEAAMIARHQQCLQQQKAPNSI